MISKIIHSVRTFLLGALFSGVLAPICTTKLILLAQILLLPVRVYATPELIPEVAPATSVITAAVILAFVQRVQAVWKNARGKQLEERQPKGHPDTKFPGTGSSNRMVSKDKSKIAKDFASYVWRSSRRAIIATRLLDEVRQQLVIVSCALGKVANKSNDDSNKTAGETRTGQEMYLRMKERCRQASVSPIPAVDNAVLGQLRTDNEALRRQLTEAQQNFAAATREFEAAGKITYHVGSPSPTAKPHQAPAFDTCWNGEICAYNIADEIRRRMDARC
ncbi:hypothetical protein Q9L58_009666 [Maublancomyces gigas]|uniref:Uncharacterized protein n=1 Tax=Discina gigas TaxID=1032678 RepID=A0ABR3G672_9PEZI